jgi:RNA polymerase sigma-70 factor (ECF subfamily)
MPNTALVAARRRQAWGERLVRAFADIRAELILTLTRYLGSLEDAQDVVQDTFLKCWRRRDRIGEVRNLRAWIFRIGFNAARDLQRNVWRRRVRPLSEEPEGLTRDDSSPTDPILYAEDLDRLGAALVRLRAEERAVFLLRQNTSLTYEEIAARRCIPVGTAKTQMRTALYKLRATLHDQD